MPVNISVIQYIQGNIRNMSPVRSMALWPGVASSKGGVQSRNEKPTGREKCYPSFMLNN